MPRSLSAIAADIVLDPWSQSQAAIHARPYIRAMRELNSIRDDYGSDDARSIVNYFLGNAGTWRGETARRIKDELKSLLKDK